MRLLAFAIAALLAAAPLVSRADDAAGLLAKHKAFVGWQFGDGTFSSLTVDGTITDKVNGQSKVVESFHGLRAGVAKRYTYRNGDGTTADTGFTGHVYWRTNYNGFTYPSLGDVQKLDVGIDLLYNEATTELPGTMNGTKSIEGATYDIVRVTPAQAFPIDLYVDPQTGAYRRAVIDPAGAYETTWDIFSYKDALPGKKIISSWSVDGGPQTYEVQRVAANAPVSTSDLHPPAQTAQWTTRTGQPFPIKALYGDYDGGVRLNASINGVPGTFIMDTGAHAIYLTGAFAGRAHVKHLYGSEASGIGGSVKTHVDKLDTFEIGGNTMKNLIVEDGDSRFGEGVDGLIGFDLFAGSVVSLNLDQNQMTISDPQTTAVDTSQGITLLVDLSGETPVVPMKLDGRVPVNTLIDSGDGGTLMIAPSILTNNHIPFLVENTAQGVFRSHRAFWGVGGISVSECATIDSMNLGPIAYQNTMACKLNEDLNDAIVGWDFIQHFNFVFDYPQAQITLIPRKNQ